MATIPRSQVRLVIEKESIRELEIKLKKMAKKVGTKEAENLIDTALERGVKPWQNAFNNGQMYRYVDRRTGGFDKPMGNRKIKGLRKKVYGRKVLPKTKGKTGGWRAHFFARPARQISKRKRVPFYRMFAQKTPTVIAKVNKELAEVMKYLIQKGF
jgi:hypothetical protein